jgi:hypothetical protein
MRKFLGPRSRGQQLWQGIMNFFFTTVIHARHVNGYKPGKGDIKTKKAKPERRGRRVKQKTEGEASEEKIARSERPDF